MATAMKIAFVSDVSCPWCVIGLRSLEQALTRLDGVVQAEIEFQPFELNPQMGAAGQDIREHLVQKYGLTPAQYEQNTEALRARGEAVGFTFSKNRSRIYNTFDAHRLLHWAALEGRQLALKHALLAGYFTDGLDVSAHEVLVAVAEQAGLDAARAREILASSEYADEVREQERFYREQGVQAVPSVIINDRHLIQGGQPAEVFEQALRKIAAGA